MYLSFVNAASDAGTVPLNLFWLISISVMDVLSGPVVIGRGPAKLQAEAVISCSTVNFQTTSGKMPPRFGLLSR